MKILKNAGMFEVLSKTDDVIGQIANAARTCWQSHDRSSPESDRKLVSTIIDKGHHAMIEFADMTVKFYDVSRGFTHEMVRHRLCSFGQESTRYVDESDFKVVVPPHKDEYKVIVESSDEMGLSSLAEWLDMNEAAYRSLRTAGWKPEDARQVLPIAIKSQIVVKANLREWRHIFKMRCDRYAHWEIRGMMIHLLTWCQKHIPIIFDDFHFFETDTGIKYACPVLSHRRMKEELDRYMGANALQSVQKVIESFDNSKGY